MPASSPPTADSSGQAWVRVGVIDGHDVGFVGADQRMGAQHVPSKSLVVEEALCSGKY